MVLTTISRLVLWLYSSGDPPQNAIIRSPNGCFPSPPLFCELPPLGVPFLHFLATQKLQDANGLDLLLKAAAAQQASAPNETDGMKKTKKPLIPLHGAYNASVIVGRGSQATLNLGRINRQVSRRHAVVQWNESVGSFQITVLGQNGVRINGAGYPSGEETRLKDGDIVDLVGVKMVFCSPKSSDGLESSSVQSLGLETPTRTPKSVRQLATPTFSSPLDDDKRSPSAHHAFSRKYDHRYNSPPLSSDAGTEFGSSPVKSRQIFTLSNEDSPVRRPLGLESPRSDDNIFLDDYPLRTPTKSSSQRSPLAPLPLNGAKSNVSKTQPAIVRTGSESQATTTITSAKPSKKSTAPTKPAVVDKNTKQKATPSVKEKEHEGKASVASPKKEKSKTTKDSHPVVTKSPKVKDVHPSTTESTKAKESQQQPSTTTKTAKTAAPKTLAAPPVAVKELSHTSKTSKDTNKTGQIIKDSEKKSKVDTDDHSHSDDDEEDGPLSSSEESSPEEETSGKKSTMDYTEMIIDTLVFARKKKSMTLSELFDEMIASQPSLMATQTSEEIKEQMIKCLSAARCVGKITRKGKDANNKPLENQWYYIPEYDYNTMRKQTRQEVMPSARACTLKVVLSFVVGSLPALLDN